MEQKVKELERKHSELSERVKKIERRVVKNEENSRQRNVRVFGVMKGKVNELPGDTDKEKLMHFLQNILVDGFKAPYDLVVNIIEHGVDCIHWMPQTTSEKRDL